MLNRRGPKEHPADHDEKEGDDDIDDSRQPSGNPHPDYFIQNQKEPVIDPPEYKRPVGPVPESADDEA